MTPVQWTLILDIINGLGVAGVLLTVVIFFYRGDILSRRVYKELTENLMNKFVDRVCKELASSIEKSVGEAIDCVMRERLSREE